jgi:hypothetical protein
VPADLVAPYINHLQATLPTSSTSFLESDIAKVVATLSDPYHHSIIFDVLRGGA